jgi:hypothetical protein
MAERLVFKVSFQDVEYKDHERVFLSIPDAVEMWTRMVIFGTALHPTLRAEYEPADLRVPRATGPGA